MMRNSAIWIVAMCWLGSGCGAWAEGEEERWYKGNTHTHSLWSDGNDFPEMITDWYEKQGYHFLGISDHNVLQRGEKWLAEGTIEKRKRGLGKPVIEKYVARFGSEWVEEREKNGTREVRLKPLEEYRELFEKPGEFLLLDAEEISNNAKPLIIHINAINLDEVIPPVGGADAREIMRKNFATIREQEKRLGRPILAHLNHPNFQWAVSAEDLAHVVETRYFEVYNGHPSINHLGGGGRQGDEKIWDIANTIRIGKLGAPPLFGVATDDSHTYHGGDVSPGRGWVMVRAEALEAGALIEAMRAGDFYASSGVTLREVSFDQEEGKLKISIEADGDATYTTEIIGTEKGYDESVEEIPAPAKFPHAVRYRYADDVGKVLATIEGSEVEYRLRGDELYVRATVTSSKAHGNPSFKGQKKQAWVQPVGWREE